MTNLIWKIVKWVFRKTIAAQMLTYANVAIEKYKENEKTKKKYFLEVAYPGNTKVIVVGNEPTPLQVAIVTGYQKINDQYFLIFKDVNTGKEFFSLDTRPLYWNQELENLLSKMDWVERWNIISHGKFPLTPEDKARKEASTAGYIKQPSLLG